MKQDNYYPDMTIAPDRMNARMPEMMPERMVPGKMPETMPERMSPGKMPERMMPETMPERMMPGKMPERMMPETMPERMAPGKMQDRQMNDMMPDKACVPWEQVIKDVKIAHAYVPIQKLCTTLMPMKSLIEGTAFPELIDVYGWESKKGLRSDL